MSEKEKQIVEKLKEAIPKMSDFDKGYILGKVESIADEVDKEKEEKEWGYARDTKTNAQYINRYCEYPKTYWARVKRRKTA